MDLPTANRLREIFEEALKLPSGERTAYLNRVCSFTPALRTEVERLLSADSQAVNDGFLENPVLEWQIMSQELRLPFNEADQRKYRIIRQIGVGGMGTVYEARTTNPERPVAIKIMQWATGDDRFFQESLRRFRDEQHILARIDNHPNIVTFLDGGFLSDGRPYFVMQYVEGQSLETRLASGPLDAAQVVAIVSQVSKALAFAHQADIVHRDIKPSNILLSQFNGELHAQVLDFGIAVIKSSLDEMARDFSQHVICTPLYASPEQAEGKNRHEIDQRSDIYSLGCVVYEMLTGNKVFSGFNQMQILNRRLDEMPVPPSACRPDLHIPAAVDAVMLKALERHRDLRYSHVLAFAKDLEAALRQPVDRDDPHQDDQPRTKVWRKLLPIAAILLLLLGGAAAVRYWPRPSNPVQTPPTETSATANLPSSSSNSDAPSGTVATQPADASANRAPNTPAPGFELTLLRRIGDRQIAVAPSEKFRNGDSIRLLLVPSQAGYVYLLHRGSSEQVSILCPDARTDNRVSAGQRFQFPAGTDDWIRFDKKQGTETLYVILATRKPEPLLAALEEALASEQKTMAAASESELLAKLQAQVDSPAAGTSVKVLHLQHH